MPRKFPSPKDVVTIKSMGQHLGNIVIETGLDPATGEVNPEFVAINYEINELRDDNTYADANGYAVKFADMPTPLKTAMRNLRKQILAYAESQDQLEAGEDEGEV